MSDIGADVLAEWRVVPEDVASLPVFAFGSCGGFVVESIDIRLRQVLFGTGGRLCRMKLCLMKGMKVVC